MHRADDLELRVLGDALVDARGDLVVDEDAGEAADLEQVAALRQLLGEVEHLVLAHLLEVDRDPPGAGLGDDAVEGDDGDPGVAGLLDRAVQAFGRGGVEDDRVVALQDQVLDLRRLLGHLVLGGGEGVGGGDRAVGDRGRRHLLPALQHRLAPGVAGVVVRQRDALVRCIRQRRSTEGGSREQHREDGSGHFILPVSLVSFLAFERRLRATGSERDRERSPGAEISSTVPFCSRRSRLASSAPRGLLFQVRVVGVPDPLWRPGATWLVPDFS